MATPTATADEKLGRSQRDHPRTGPSQKVALGRLLHHEEMTSLHGQRGLQNYICY
jgi:hypothetical protein